MESLNDTTFESTSTFWNDDFVTSNSGNSTSVVALTRKWHAGIASIVIAAMVFGFLSNVLVFVVHVHHLTTSTRVYMISLATMDATVCFAVGFGATFNIESMYGPVVLIGIVYTVTTAALFSMMLLAFVATERFVAVLRPHTYNSSSRRAIRAVAVVGVIGATYAAVVVTAKTLSFDVLLMSLRFILMTSTVVFIVFSYSVVAMVLWKRSRDKAKSQKKSRNAVGVELEIKSSSAREKQPEVTASMSMFTTLTKITSAVVAPRVKSKVVINTSSHSNLLLLFVITALYIVCWTPFWLYSIGFPVNVQLSRLYVLQPVANPLVYSFISPIFRDLLRQFFRETRNKLTRCCQ